MAQHKWHPRTSRPEGLVTPVRIDPTGENGPTRGQLLGSRWRRVSRGLYVPAAVDPDVVEQRIVEQAARLPAHGAVTGWASLRWRGATFFDGTTAGGTERLPVPLLLGVGGNIRSSPHGVAIKEFLMPAERELVAGVACTTTDRAVFDEIRRTGLLREGVVALDMAIAAGLTTLAAMTHYVETHPRWSGIVVARQMLPLVDGDSRSPMESRMRLVWVLDAGFPPPLCNWPVFDLHGNLLGYPDLLDVEAGVIGEYMGEDHKDGERHRRDVQRAAVFRDHGLEIFEVVGGDVQRRKLVVERMRATRRRALWLPPEERKWTLEPPPWWRGPGRPASG